MAASKGQWIVVQLKWHRISEITSTQPGFNRIDLRCRNWFVARPDELRSYEEPPSSRFICPECEAAR